MKDIGRKIIVSTSGGKDSTACCLMALEMYPDEDIMFVSADTGNEHEETLDYIDNYLPTVLGKKVDVVKADFTRQIAHKREFVLSHWADHGISQSKIDRAVNVLQPTGNPYLDLCIWKGRFPSRRAQFCTSELKILPIAEYQANFMMDGYRVESWQGVRRDESQARRNAKCWEVVDNDYWVRRPIVTWTAQETVDYIASKGVELNPLYKQGMGRVGCMPCINCRKSELYEIQDRFPEHIKRIEEWESIVAEASKRGAATFFASTGDFETPAAAMVAGNISQKVEWSKTARGGRQYDLLLATQERPACSSAYGLCE